MADGKNTIKPCARSTVGQYPFNSPFEVSEHDDCPAYLDVNKTVPDSVMPKFPPKGHLVNATGNVDEAAWGGSETRRSMQQQGQGTIKRSNS